MSEGLGSAKRVLTYPHMGNYRIAFDALAERLGCEVQAPPPITRRTIEIGTRHSPEFVCLPFKYNLGNYIEALDRGANVLVQAAGGCRFNYYAEVQEVILRDMGYEFEFLRLTGTRGGVLELLDKLKALRPGATTRDALAAFAIAWAKSKALEAVEDVVRKNVGFEAEEGSFERLEKEFHRELKAARTVRASSRVGKEFRRGAEAVPTVPRGDMLRVGVVGELYLVMEPFSNYFLEKELAQRGVEVHRFITLTEKLFHAFTRKHYQRTMLELASPYLSHHIGADGTESVAMAHKLMREGFDGLIHVKPFGCMPEVNAMPALQRLSREHMFPIVYFSFDSQASETGVRTRLEAFCDMLRMRKAGRAFASDQPVVTAEPAGGVVADA